MLEGFMEKVSFELGVEDGVIVKVVMIMIIMNR